MAEHTHCQVLVETRRFGPMACGTRIPCDIHPPGVTEDDGRLQSAIAQTIEDNGFEKCGLCFGTSCEENCGPSGCKAIPGDPDGHKVCNRCKGTGKAVAA